MDSEERLFDILRNLALADQKIAQHLMTVQAQHDDHEVRIRTLEDMVRRLTGEKTSA